MQQYSPVLGERLEFPETWQAVILIIGPNSFFFFSFMDVQDAINNFGLRSTLGREWLFFHFHEMVYLTLHAEKENRQFCMMVDMVSWYCSGAGTISGLDHAPELPF